MTTKLTYNELEQNLIEKGFTRTEADTLTNWWSQDWDWLYNAGAEEIREASKPAFESEDTNF